MKKGISLILVLLVGFFMLQGTADAKLVSGKVDSVDVAAKTITISSTDSATGAESKNTVSISDSATYTGVASLDQVQVGDEVWVEAEEDAATGTWKTNAVDVTPATPAAASDTSATQ